MIPRFAKIKSAYYLVASLLITAMIVPLVQAVDIVVSATLDVSFTIGGHAVTCQLMASGLTTFSVTGDQITMAVPAGHRPSIQCPTSISYGPATACDIPAKSTFAFSESATTTATLTQPASTDAGYIDSCDGRRGGGGGGNIGYTSGPTGGGPPLVTVQPQTKIKPEVTEKKAEEKKPKMVDFSDLGKLKEEKVELILTMTQRMVDNKTFVAGNKFKPNAVVNWDFAVRLVLGGFLQESCGKSLNYDNCRKAAIKLGFLDKDDGGKRTSRVMRTEYYGLLLEALQIPIMTTVTKGDISACKDLTLRSKDVLIVATALKYNIATVYKGKKCLANSAFSRAQAVDIANKAIMATLK